MSYNSTLIDTRGWMTFSAMNTHKMVIIYGKSFILKPSTMYRDIAELYVSRCTLKVVSKISAHFTKQPIGNDAHQLYTRLVVITF